MAGRWTRGGLGVFRHGNLRRSLLTELKRRWEDAPNVEVPACCLRAFLRFVPEFGSLFLDDKPFGVGGSLGLTSRLHAWFWIVRASGKGRFRGLARTTGATHVQTREWRTTLVAIWGRGVELAYRADGWDLRMQLPFLLT